MLNLVAMTFQEAAEWCMKRGVKVHMASKAKGTVLMTLDAGKTVASAFVQDLEAWTKAFIALVEELRMKLPSPSRELPA